MDMQHMLEDVVALSRRRGVVEVDRPEARLALLVVLDHLDRVLDRDELEELAATMPAGLAVMLERRRGYDRAPLELVSSAAVAVVCEVLAALPVDDAVAARLRRDVPWRLASGGGPERRRRGAPGLLLDHDDRPTLRVVGQLRPTVVPAPALRQTA